ncbi:hypothetical protein [uncultured Bradyrhizobium sp.]|uniref:hypothetical protein n=1 Tax=uncultured Bradyrhizobium sp. TaxID=199684 RepID=UPI00262B5E28|nr:hypothetical protein [uncultured Bradyrhizobium sp.]
MNKFDPSQKPSDLRSPFVDAETAANKDTPDRPGMTRGRGRSVGYVVGVVIALAAIVTAGLLFGRKGWLTASLGGISILFLLPCAVMCVGVIWMMIKGGRSGSS